MSEKRYELAREGAHSTEWYEAELAKLREMVTGAKLQAQGLGRDNVRLRETLADLEWKAKTELDQAREALRQYEENYPSLDEIARLREREMLIVKALGVPDGGRYVNDIVQHAESLREENTRLHNKAGTPRGDLLIVAQERDQARDENTRLREALEEIAVEWETGCPCPDIARNTLEETT